MPPGIRRASSPFGQTPLTPDPACFTYNQDVVDACNRREVPYEIRAAHGFAHGVRIEDVSSDDREIPVPHELATRERVAVSVAKDSHPVLG